VETIGLLPSASITMIAHLAADPVENMNHHPASILP
jgi:hypothetical protein